MIRMKIMNNKFNIPSCNLGYLQSRFEKLNKKAKKLGVPEIGFTVLDEIIHKDEFGVIVGKSFEVEIFGETPKLPGGWNFLGTLQHTPEGNILRSVPHQEIPEIYRDMPCKCDHCQTKRNRKDSFVIRNENGEVKQIGKNCIRDFLGHINPEHIAWLASLAFEIKGILGDSGNDHGTKMDFVASLGTVLNYAAAATQRYGWVSSQAAQAYAEKSGGSRLTTTASHVWGSLFPDMKKLRSNEEYRKSLVESSEESKKLADEALAWFNTEIASKTKLSNYEHNLLMASKLPTISYKELGLVVSLIGVYQRHLEKQAARPSKNTTAESKHFGEVGKREIFTLIFKKEHVLDSSYSEDGQRYMYQFCDTEGNVAIWWASHKQEFNVNETYKIKATVKSHTEYKNRKQTIIQRSTVVE